MDYFEWRTIILGDGNEVIEIEDERRGNIDDKVRENKQICG